MHARESATAGEDSRAAHQPLSLASQEVRLRSDTRAHDELAGCSPQERAHAQAIRMAFAQCDALPPSYFNAPSVLSAFDRAMRPCLALACESDYTPEELQRFAVSKIMKFRAMHPGAPRWQRWIAMLAQDIHGHMDAAQLTARKQKREREERERRAASVDMSLASMYPDF